MWSREVRIGGGKTKLKEPHKSVVPSLGYFTETMAHFYLQLSFLLMMTSEARGEHAAGAFHRVLIKLQDGTNVHS